MDSTLLIDPELVTDSVRTLALNTLTAYRNGITLKWNDAELAVYLVYIFGEINKSEFVFSSFLDFGSHTPIPQSWRKGASGILPSTTSDTR